MMNRRARVIMGQLLIIIGLALPLYGFFGLAKGILFEDLAFKQFMEGEASYSAELDQKIQQYNANISQDTRIVDPFATDQYRSAYSTEAALIKDRDEVFAYLDIPKLGLAQPIYLDASYRHLAMGVAHIEGTDLPSGAPGTRSVIAGHRGYYEAIMFLHLDTLVPGDEVYVKWPDKTLAYQVRDKEMIYAWQTEKLNPIANQTVLTLLTCESAIFARSERLLVNCVPVPPVETTSPVNDVPVASEVRRWDTLILLTTGLLLLAFLWRIIKFISLLWSRSGT